MVMENCVVVAVAFTTFPVVVALFSSVLKFRWLTFTISLVMFPAASAPTFFCKIVLVAVVVAKYCTVCPLTIIVVEVPDVPTAGNVIALAILAL